MTAYLKKLAKMFLNVSIVTRQLFISVNTFSFFSRMAFCEKRVYTINDLLLIELYQISLGDGDSMRSDGFSEGTFYAICRNLINSYDNIPTEYLFWELYTSLHYQQHIVFMRISKKTISKRKSSFNNV